MPSSPFEQQVTIVNKRGLHARASAKFVHAASEFDCEIKVAKDGMTVLGTSIMGLMLLAAACGDQIMISASGQAAEQALETLVKLVAKGFHEE